MTNEFSCIIIDDEYDAIKLLKKRLLLLFKNIGITGEYTAWDDALAALQSMPCDIVFMDISMPGKDGLNLLKLVPTLESEIIFVTAYEEYAINAFKFSTAGYILKPIDDDELAYAVNKAIERVRVKQLIKQKPDKQQPAVKANKIGILNSKGIDFLDVDDILYFEAVKGYTKVVTADKEVLSSFSIGKFKTMPGAEVFYQVHRSYIVNINYVKGYKMTGEITMINNKVIPVAKSSREDFLHLFNTVTGKSGEEIV